MKRALEILTAVLAACVLGIVAVSPASAYPPHPPSLSTPTPTVNVGEPVTLTASGFVAGPVIRFTIGDTSAGTAVANARGEATIVASSPPTPGTFGITATSSDGAAAGLTLTVLPAGASIPSTGTDSTDLSLTAGVLVLVGVGLLGGSLMRRRNRAMIAV